MKNLLFTIITIAVLLSSCTSDSPEAREVAQYTIEQFMNNESVFGSSFSHDYSKILIGSDQSGIFNAYTIDIATGDRTTLTSSDDRAIRPSSFFPDDDRILFMSDNNGDEIDHIFVRNEDASIEELTTEDGAKAIFAGWADNEESFYYLYNARDPQYFDFHRMSIDPFTSELLYENNDGLDISGISRDERYFALSKTITTNDSDIFLYDRQTGKQVQINQKQGGHSIADFSLDNQFLYYLSDVDAEFQYLIKYDIQQQTSEKVHEEDWDIWYAYFSKTGKYQVMGINADASTKIKIIDIESGDELATPDVGEGEITSVNISDDEQWMAFYAGSSNLPSNLFIYNLESGNTKQLTNTLNTEINKEDLVTGERIRYGSFDDLQIPAILFKPHGATAANKVPAIVQVHGGPGGQSRMSYSSLYQFLVNHGYAVLRVNNRGSSGYGKTFYQMDDLQHGDVDLKDVIAGKEYLETLDWVDVERIGILGGSYGGYMTMRAMTHTPDEFKVGVNIFGVTNWLRTLRSIPSWWTSFQEALYKELGDPNTADSVRLYDISPLFHADQVKNPVIVLQGGQDPRVLQVESDEMVDAMKANGVPVEYVLFDDEGHGFRKKENQIEGWGKIMAFLDKHLKGEEFMN